MKKYIVWFFFLNFINVKNQDKNTMSITRGIDYIQNEDFPEKKVSFLCY